MKKIFFILFISNITHALDFFRLPAAVTQQPEAQVHHARAVESEPTRTTCMDRLQNCELKCLCGSCACSTCATIGLGAATYCSPTNTFPLLGGTAASGVLACVLACILLNRGCKTMSCDHLRFWGS